MASVKLVSLLLVCMVVAPLTTQAISCGQVSSALAPCLNYLKGTEPAPQAACCSGVKSINSAAQTTPDRKTACGCLKSAAGSIPGLKDSLAASLPGKCGVSIPYKISMSTNCNSIK